jgi:hypothetical protein
LNSAENIQIFTRGSPRGLKPGPGRPPEESHEIRKLSEHFKKRQERIQRRNKDQKNRREVKKKGL